MHLGCIYLIVNDYQKSISFYEQLLNIPITAENKDRFAQFNYKGHNIAIMNGHFDSQNPDKITREGEYTAFFDDTRQKALAPNTNKFVLNFWTDDLQTEYKRIKNLAITNQLSEIKYFHYASPYYHFHLTDPDDNMIEIAGNYPPIV